MRPGSLTAGLLPVQCQAGLNSGDLGASTIEVGLSPSWTIKRGQASVGITATTCGALFTCQALDTISKAASHSSQH